jgi:hypothetical protein
METFCLIINKIFKIENNNFFITINGIDSTIRMHFALNTIITDETIPLYKRKFKLLKTGLESFMIKNCKEEEYISYFYNIQRVYNVLNRFIYNYKFKKSKIVVNTDMTLNELKENDPNVICIYHENARYLFKMYDLLKIINMSLLNMQNFFANPLCIKNPYNNLPFGKHILYSIYYFIINKSIIVSNIKYTELFFKFYSCHFNLTTFLDKYEYMLREKVIVNYVNNSISDVLYKDIKTMLYTFNNKFFRMPILIHKDFPKASIIKIFSPYLILFMNSKYLLVPTLKYKATIDLEIKLKNFQKFNPLFGRSKILFKSKFCKDGKIRNFKIGEFFNEKHIIFNEYDNDAFLKDHLAYKHIYLEEEEEEEEIEEEEEEEEDEEEEEEVEVEEYDYDDEL